MEVLNLRKIELSTGVLSVDPDTVSIVVNIANVDIYCDARIVVEIWDWSSYDNPVKLPVLYNENEEVKFPYYLKTKNLAVFYADLFGTNVELYEVRIINIDGRNIIANCFGRDPQYHNKEGQTVLNSQLTKLISCC